MTPRTYKNKKVDSLNKSVHIEKLTNDEYMYREIID